MPYYGITIRGGPTKCFASIIFFQALIVVAGYFEHEYKVKLANITNLNPQHLLLSLHTSGLFVLI